MDLVVFYMFKSLAVLFKSHNNFLLIFKYKLGSATFRETYVFAKTSTALGIYDIFLNKHPSYNFFLAESFLRFYCKF